MATANTPGVFTEFIGQRLIGVLHGLPGQQDGPGSHNLVFEDGRALSFNANGSYWIDPPELVLRGAEVHRRRLERLMDESRELMALTGVLPSKES